MYSAPPMPIPFQIIEVRSGGRGRQGTRLCFPLKLLAAIKMKSVRHGLMLLSVISWLGRACAQRDQHVQLQFSFFTSFGGGFISSGSVPAVGLALQQVASQAILPGYTLNYVLRDSMVHYTSSV